MSESSPGDLRLRPEVLREIFERLEEPGTVLTLHVVEDADEKVIYFSGGGVRILSVGSRSGEDIGGHLLANGLLEIDQLHEVLERVRSEQVEFREVVTSQGLISSEDYDHEMSRLVLDEFLDLVFWEEAYFSCSDRAPPPEIFRREGNALAVSLAPREFIDDVCDWTHQWERQRRALRSDRSVITITSAGFRKLDKQSSGAKEILRRCLDPIDLRSLWKSSRVPLPELCDRLCEFLEERWITIAPPVRDSSPQARLEEIERLEESLPRVLGKDLLRERLVSLCRRAGLTQRALRRLEELADSAENDSEPLLCLERLKKILALDPTRIEALERAIGIYTKLHRVDEARRLARVHAFTLLDRGATSEARTVGRLLKGLRTESGGESSDILGRVLSRAGHGRSAVEQYLAIAAEHEREGDTEHACQMLLRALKLSPKDEKALERLDRIDPKLAERHRGRSAASAERGKRGRRRRPALAMPSRALVVALALSLAAAGLHFTGTVRFDGLLEDVLAWAESTGKRKADEPARSGGERERETSSAARPETVAGTVELPGGARAPEEGRAGIAPGDVDDHVRDLFQMSGGEEGRRQSRPVVAGPPGDFAGGEPPPTLPSSAGSFEPVERDWHGGPREANRSAGEGNDGPSSVGSGSSPLDAPPVAGAPDASSDRAALASPGTGDRGDRDRDRDDVARWSVIPPPIPPALARLQSCGGGDAGGLVRRMIDDRILVGYGPSCNLVALDVRTGRIKFRVPGRPGYRWALGYHAERICRWRPGHRSLIYNPLSDTHQATVWEVPEEAEALAVGLDRIALRLGAETWLVSHQGRVLATARLPAWQRGVFVDASLILTRDTAGGGEPAGMWVVRPTGLRILWACVRDPVGFLVR